MSLPPPRTEEIGDGLFAYVQPDGSWGINNAGFLTADGTTYVVDTCVTEARTRALIETIRQRDATPVTALLNTHHHRDHTFGNYLVQPAPIVGHRLCRDEVIRLGLGPKDVIPAEDFGHIEIAPPNLVFDDRLTLYLGDGRPIEAIYVGPAHTTNDVVYWLPDDRVLYAGDVVFHRGVPYLAEGTLEGSLHALDRLADLAPDVIVPGHGDVCGPAVLDQQRDYLLTVRTLANEALENAADPHAVARDARLTEYAGWTCPERSVANIRLAMSELSNGEGADPGVLLADMTAISRGPMRSRA